MVVYPESYYRLPADLAQAIGQAVAGFGWLEEVLKRTIYSLDRARLADDLSEVELQAWQQQMSEIADDSMGTLIEQLDAALRRHPGIRDRVALNEALKEIRQNRNLLCHASWQPSGRAGHWHPAFVNTRGERFADELSIPEIETMLQDTHELGHRLIRIMRATGIPGEWPGDEKA